LTLSKIHISTDQLAEVCPSTTLIYLDFIKDPHIQLAEVSPSRTLIYLDFIKDPHIQLAEVSPSRTLINLATLSNTTYQACGGQPQDFN
jgi:hypothetical protein